MPTVNEILLEIDQKVEQAVTLTVGKMSDDELDAYRLLLRDDAADGFRE